MRAVPSQGARHMGILGFPTMRTRAMWSRGSFGAVNRQGESGFVKPSSRDVICPEARKLMALSSSCVWASHHPCLSSSCFGRRLASTSSLYQAPWRSIWGAIWASGSSRKEGMWLETSLWKIGRGIVRTERSVAAKHAKLLLNLWCKSRGDRACPEMSQ